MKMPEPVEGRVVATDEGLRANELLVFMVFLALHIRASGCGQLSTCLLREASLRIRMSSYSVIKCKHVHL